MHCMSRFRACGPSLPYTRACIPSCTGQYLIFIHYSNVDDSDVWQEKPRPVTYYQNLMGHLSQPTVHWRIVAIVGLWFSHRTPVCSSAIPTISGFLTKRYVVFYSYKYLHCSDLKPIVPYQLSRSLPPIIAGSESSNVFRQRQLNQSHVVMTPSVKIKYVDIQYPKIKTGVSIVTVGMWFFFFFFF
ncbi:hypothetical protein F5888DRAFT_437891 [Russula emetica]|nr:hypothetical protein F5888DRAFT_437891 [Russula emetica]